MAKRLTAMEAHAVKTRLSEPVGSKGMGSLLLERKASGAIMAFYRERTPSTDRRLQIGILSKQPAPGSAEMTLQDIRAEALRIATEAACVGGLAAYLQRQAEDAAQAEIDRAKKKREQEEAAKRGTFGEMLASYCDHLEAAGKASAKKVRSLFKVNVLEFRPDLAARYADEITPEDIADLLNAVLLRRPKGRGIGNKAAAPSTNMRSTTDELRRYIRTAFKYAAAAHLAVGCTGSDKRFRITTNPAAIIAPIEDASGGNTESMQPAELSSLLRYLDTLHARDARKAAIAKALIYLGGQRIRQLLAVGWEHMTDHTLTLLDLKGRKVEAWEHLLPITPQIKAILAPLTADRIGPGPFCLKEGVTANRDTIARVFTDASKALVKTGETTPFSWQRVRATCETLLAANGVSSETRAWLLSHGRSGVQAKHYDRNSYLPEKTEALLLWGNYLDTLKGNDAHEGITIRRRRKIEA
ncbi:tyrosine-type recombinase/integrase [Stutzerimonas nitrititolerans]|uniref:tyrosine-type recombinase/integrase n=1 Tax=Stutzerimonas nitrititolerans TaxID=2482751 RepID=UPI0028B137DF|nr:integrase [Stutzerimonas nitrititolerans]